MSGETCEIPENILEEFQKFKLSKSKTSNMMTFKINAKQLTVEVDEIQEDIDFDEVRDEVLPEAAPLYLAFSFKMQHDHDRVSYPLVFVFFCPSGINPKLNMMYASTKTRLSNKLEIIKSFDLRDRKDFSYEWLKNKIGK
eukprot:TRINITY_DN13971_c0_g1_i1.p1 TRINITY_DN13971_c0_g1~~TRINITY_DN13971_c0_g1_i1.p1  ORF type:complete len:147 (-),score=50.44 TRINITY_DN13971_c0_g1_i1:50-469(-)